MTKACPGSERRKYIRVAEEDLMVCEVFTADALQNKVASRTHVFSKDISEGGLLFESSILFDIGTYLKLEVDIPGLEKFKSSFLKLDKPTRREPLVVIGKVVRVEEIDPFFFDIGISFSAVDAGEKQALKKYIEHTIKNSNK